MVIWALGLQNVTGLWFRPQIILCVIYQRPCIATLDLEFKRPCSDDIRTLRGACS